MKRLKVGNRFYQMRPGMDKHKAASMVRKHQDAYSRFVFGDGSEPEGLHLVLGRIFPEKIYGRLVVEENVGKVHGTLLEQAAKDRKLADGKGLKVRFH